MKSLQWGSQGHPERILGSLGAVLGGPWVPGCSQATFWIPMSDPGDKGARSGGSWGGLGGTKNRPRLIFYRPRGIKVLRSRVSSMSTFSISEVLRGARERQGEPLGCPGGSCLAHRRPWGGPGGACLAHRSARGGPGERVHEIRGSKEGPGHHISRSKWECSMQKQ